MISNSKVTPHIQIPNPPKKIKRTKSRSEEAEFTTTAIRTPKSICNKLKARADTYTQMSRRNRERRRSQSENLIRKDTSDSKETKVTIVKRETKSVDPSTGLTVSAPSSVSYSRSPRS